MRKLLTLSAVLLLVCAEAHAAQVVVHFTSHTGFGMYGERLEQRGPDGFGDLDVLIDFIGAGAARVSWNGVEYHGAVITSELGESHIVFPDEYGLDVITLYPSGICGVTAQRVSAVTGKPNILAVPCVYD